MQHNFNNSDHQGLPKYARDNLEQAVAVLTEHFDDVVVAVTHSDSKSIKVISSNPYAGLGMLPTIQQKLRDVIDQAEFTQLIYEESADDEGS